MAQPRSRTAVRTVLRVARDLLQLVSSAWRSHAQLAVENFQLFWRWKSVPRGRPRLPADLQRLIAETAQQFRMVVSGEQTHRFVIHDRDSIYAEGVDATVATMGLTVFKTLTTTDARTRAWDLASCSRRGKRAASRHTIISCRLTFESS
jgi:hypothetical protein